MTKWASAAMLESAGAGHKKANSKGWEAGLRQDYGISLQGFI